MLHRDRALGVRRTYSETIDVRTAAERCALGPCTSDPDFQNLFRGCEFVTELQLLRI